MLRRVLPLFLTAPQAYIGPQASAASQALATLNDLGDRVQRLCMAGFWPEGLRLEHKPGQAIAPKVLTRTELFPPEVPSAVGSRRAFLLKTHAEYQNQLFPGPAARWRFGVVCDWLEEPLTAPGEGPVIARVSNHGDAYGERIFFRGPLTCPAAAARDWRDLLAAQFADRNGRVSLNQPSRPEPWLTRLARHRPWVRISFSPSLVQGHAGGFAARGVEDLQARWESVLTLFCRVQGWEE